MKELLYTIVAELVDDPSAIAITEDTDENGVHVLHLHVAEEDMGRVIGKQGRIAKTIRTLVRAGAINKGMENVTVEIG